MLDVKELFELGEKTTGLYDPNEYADDARSHFIYYLRHIDHVQAVKGTHEILDTEGLGEAGTAIPQIVDVLMGHEVD